ncbi:MAG TPA: TlpA disulfide reductase family protein [Chitinophagaceae bacterium]|nr:TlpA disulfide reductase family protein [Chitinophagaceae bacterium]
MRKIFFSALVSTILLACKHEGKKEFIVDGKIRNAGAQMVYLQETPLATGERIIEDSSGIGGDGSFRLKGKAGEESLFSLLVKNEPYPFAFVINDAEEITVNVDLKNPNGYVIHGSTASESLRDFSLKTSAKWFELSNIGRAMDSLKKSGAPDSILLTENNKGMYQVGELRNFVASYVKNSNDPITSVWALGTYSQVFPSDEYQALLNGIVKKFPNHKGIAAIKEMSDRQLALAKQKDKEEPTEPEWIGKPAPELSLPDINGRKINLSSFKGKYVLVDFWASWCLPCRRENPNVVQAYNKYKSKNFTILGVSLDKEKEDWMDAIQHDKLTWTQVSDLQEWNSLAVSTFNFNGIPFNVLIDPAGRIIGQSLRGPDLEQKLADVLK